jgi:iron uptake system component EfeO
MPRLVPALALALGALLTACGTSDGAAFRATPAVDVSVTDCGSSWQPTTAGDQDVVLRNTDQHAGEVQVIGRGPHAGLVYADVEPFGPGTTVDLRLSLAAGRYALACLMEDQAPVTGPTRTITGRGGGAPGVRILSQSQLVPATQRYQHWVRRHLAPLVRDTRRLRTLVGDGDQQASTGVRRARTGPDSIGSSATSGVARPPAGYGRMSPTSTGPWRSSRASSGPLGSTR